MPRSPYPSRSSISFGPGPLSQTLKALVFANVALFFLRIVAAGFGYTNLDFTLGLTPAHVLGQFSIWQLVTYMFVHGEVTHILFNMLALWMFGTDLEKVWGTRYFLKFYFLTGIGAGALTVLASLMPGTIGAQLYSTTVIGASGAIYGLLLAYALYFPERPILILLFPVPAKYAVMIMGAIAFFAGNTGGVANTTHLGGLLVGYLLLKGARFHPLAEAKYWYLRWKMARVRRKFGVVEGGRTDEWKRRVH
jgi:membrane associated rhomboid family serine protease